MKKYDYITIEKIKNGWFIMRYKKAVHISTKYTVKNSYYILIGLNELQQILVNGLDTFLQESMISSYPSRKQLVEKFKREPFYKQIFE